MKKLLWILALSFYAQAALAERDSGDKGNGGDEIGIEFRQAFESAATFMKGKRPDVWKKIAKTAAILPNAKVIAVDEELTIDIGGVKQVGVATNRPAKATIYVNRGRWAAITNFQIKEAVALHEFLGLAEIEGTGDYTYSVELLEARRLDTSVMLPSTGGSLVDDFRLVALRSSPEYAAALLQLSKLVKRSSIGGFSTNLTKVKVICTEVYDHRCARGTVAYELRMAYHYNDGAFETLTLGTISALVGFVDDPDAETVGAWVEKLAVRKHRQ